MLLLWRGQIPLSTSGSRHLSLCTSCGVFVYDVLVMHSWWVCSLFTMSLWCVCGAFVVCSCADLPLLPPASGATPSAATWDSSLNLQKTQTIRASSASASPNMKTSNYGVFSFSSCYCPHSIIGCIPAGEHVFLHLIFRTLGGKDLFFLFVVFLITPSAFSGGSCELLTIYLKQTLQQIRFFLLQTPEM